MRRWEIVTLAEAGHAILEDVSFLSKILDALVGRYRRGNLLPNRCRIIEVDELRRVRPNPLRELHEDLPFRAGLADPPAGDLRRKVHAPRGRWLGSAAPLLVTGLRGKQEGGVRRI